MAKKQQMQLSIILVKALDCSPEERDVGQIFKLVSGLHDGQPEEWREVILNGSPWFFILSHHVSQHLSHGKLYCFTRVSY